MSGLWFGFQRDTRWFTLSMDGPNSQPSTTREDICHKCDQREVPMLRTVPGLLAATGLAMLALSGPIAAQSFDCAKAGTAIEKKICSDPNL
ncbi:MAG: hypothetical protein AAFY56_23575, partial [Pseudomonadota bacterium]